VRAMLLRKDGERDGHKSRATSREPEHYGLTCERIADRNRDYLAWAGGVMGDRI
jgi:hypothetical protein